MKSDEQSVVQREFERLYMFSKPFSDYVNGVSLQRISNLFYLSKIPEGKKPDELCLYVVLRNELPQGIELPSDYRGLTIVSRVVGGIHEEEPIYEGE